VIIALFRRNSSKKQGILRSQRNRCQKGLGRCGLCVFPECQGRACWTTIRRQVLSGSEDRSTNKVAKSGFWQVSAEKQVRVEWGQRPVRGHGHRTGCCKRASRRGSQGGPAVVAAVISIKGYTLDSSEHYISDNLHQVHTLYLVVAGVMCISHLH